jgi:hypothetical protein
MFFAHCQPLESRSLLCVDLSTTPTDDASDDASTMVALSQPLSNPSTERVPRAAAGAQAKPREFLAKLNGKSEVPSRTTTAKGNATFNIAKKGKSISFNVTVTNLRNVVAAHLHLGQPGENGGVVVQLFGPVSPNGGLRNGRLVRGKITADKLVGTLSGQPLSSLIRQIRSGNVYINVHTDNGAGEADTGPGDFASGEIRGQLKAKKANASNDSPSDNPPRDPPVYQY